MSDSFKNKIFLGSLSLGFGLLAVWSALNGLSTLPLLFGFMSFVAAIRLDLF